MIPLGRDICRPPGKRHTFLSMVSISYMVNFVLPVFTHYIPAVGPMDPAAMGASNLWPRDIARGEWMAIPGQLCFYAGYAVPIRRFLVPMLPTKLYDWSHRGGLLAASNWIVVGWLLFIGGATGLIPAALGSGWIGGFGSGVFAGSAILAAIYLKYRTPTALLLSLITI